MRKKSLLAATTFWLAVSAMFYGGAAAAADAPAEGKPAPGWILTQKSQVCGNIQVFLTANAVKAVDAKTSTTLVSKAPDWKVVVFNRSNKTIFTCPVDKFIGYSIAGMQVQMGFQHGGVPVVKKPGTSKVLGMTANIYGTTAEYENHNRQMYLHDEGGDTLPRSAILLTSSGWALPPQEARILCRLYGLGIAQDIPLDFHCKDQVGDNSEGLSTSTIKKASIPAREFDCPSGFTRVDTMEGVRLDASGQTAMEDMLGSLDDTIGNTSGQSKKKPR
ncbi:MAG: hypothetical protein JSS86_04475 [Cyanobacteria bacterium SZAS LIN-2]|nr:hypothetical protein [Cyanobacteria bacterium SZAS LIN-2]